MKRLFLTTALCATLPFAAHADDFIVRADLAEATVYGSGADVTRIGNVTLPAGRHRILIAMPDLAGGNLPQITGAEGLRFGPPVAIHGHPIAEGALDDAEQSAARAAVETAEEALRVAQDAVTAADTAIRSIETQQAYIASLLRGGSDGAAMPDDPALIPQFLATLGEQTERLADELLEAQIARRDLVEGVTDAQVALNTATQALGALRPFGTQINAVAYTVTVGAETETDLELSYYSGDAGWEPSYEIDLDTETGLIEIDRFVNLRTFGAARWHDVAVTFSTAAPDREREPSELASRPARLIDPEERYDARSLELTEAAADALPAPAPQPLIVQHGYGNATGAGAAIEPVVIVEPQIVAEFDGLSVSYPYPEPVTVGATGEALLSFDTLELEAETENRAVPRWDDTAFLVAMAENETGEPILPGNARFYRDGALLGEDYMPLIPAGAETEIAFGALDHLQLVWIDRSLAEGDRGIFTNSTTQARELAFGVENTGDEAETVRILYSTPFAEQEDLELDVTLSPQPDERDVDDERGIHAWEIEVGSGDTELVEMGVEFEFPEGQILDWRP